MLDDQKIKSFFSRIDGHVDPGTRLCIIGSGAAILMGQPSRMTEDIDVWIKASNVNLRIFADAARRAGLLFDPKTEDVDAPYVQIVHPGIVHVPGWDGASHTWLGEPELTLWVGTNLTVSCPPPAVLIASKLVRMSDRDIDDCVWLMAQHAVTAKMVMAAIKKLPRNVKEDASGALDMLKYMN
jgi:hypothetical protein